MHLKLLFISVGVFLNLSLSGQSNFNIKRTYSETNHQIYNACFTVDGKYIITSGKDDNIIIWNSSTGIIYKTLVGLNKRPNTAIFDEVNGILVSAGEDNDITIWDPVIANISGTLKGHKSPVKSLALSQDGSTLASGSADKTVRVWDMGNRTPTYELHGHKKNVNALSFSPDGSILASAGADKKIILWNVSSGSIICSEELHKGCIRDVEFSPDGNIIASCGDDGLVNLSNATDLSLINTLTGHKGWVQTLDFSPDGKYLLSGGHDRLIMLWDVNTGKLLSQSEKQEQIVLSVDFNPVQPDFVSASLLSENLEIWAISGINDSYPTGSGATGQVLQANQKTVNQIKTDEIQSELEQAAINPYVPENSVIEILSPEHEKGLISSDKNSLFLIGRVNRPDGTSSIMVNKEIVQLSEAGLFESRINLIKGDNPIRLVTVNKRGRMSEMTLLINCTSEDAPTVISKVPEIYNNRNYALLIGVNDYESNEIMNLDNPVKDVESLYNVLVNNYTFEPGDIYLLKNPTQSEIINRLDELSRKLTPQDNLLIFYAGHGYWDKKGNVGYWFPANATKGSTLNWFRNSTLRDFIGSIATKHTLLIADACFSGAIFKTRAAFNEAPKGIERLYSLPSRKAMTSGILEEVPDESVFIRYLIRRLDENEDKYLPSEILFSSFMTAVMNNSSTVPKYGVIQNVGDEGGDFIFIKR